MPRFKSTTPSDNYGQPYSVTLISRVEAVINASAIARGGSLLISCSGGSDSVALLLACAELRDSWDFRLNAAYYDHGLRDHESVSKERDLVALHCRDLDVTFTTGGAERGEIQEAARKHRSGIESAARNSRYRFMHSLRRDLGCDRILLGHTRNDQSETRIQRFFQGSGASGALGIPQYTATIVRPLIHTEKREILRYLAQRGADFCEDESNSDAVFLRNRIRNELVPVLSDIFPGFVQSLDLQSERAGLIDRFLTDESSSRLAIYGAGKSVAFDRDEFYEAPPIIRLYALYNAIDKVGRRLVAPGTRVPYRALRDVVTAGDDGVGDEKHLLQTSWFELVRTDRRIEVRKRVEIEGEKGYLWLISSGETHRIVVGGANSHVVSEAVTRAGGPKVSVAGVPVVIRSRRTGDEIILAAKPVKLTTLFSQWSVAITDRWRVPVIEDRNGIAAVLGAVWGGENVFRPAAQGSREIYITVMVGIEV